MRSSSPDPGDLNGRPASDDPLSVLLVEDNPGDAHLFEEYLNESPIEARIYHETSLQSGLDTLGTAEPDVLVVDLGLPDSEGSETVKAAAAAAPDVPIVVLTGQGNLQAALEAQEAGAAEYLQKAELTPALAGRTLRWALQQHHMQRELRQREARIRSITDGLSAGVFRTGPTGRVEYANDALVEMLGLDGEDDLIGEDLTGFCAHQDDQERMLTSEGTQGVEIRFERADGSTFVGLVSARPTSDPSGRPLHYDGTITNITRRKEREERLRMLSEAVEQAHESVLITAADPLDEPGPRVEYVNRAYEEMTGYSREEMLGETPRILQGPETDRSVLDSLREALEAGEEWQGETVNYRKDGAPYIVQWNVSPVFGEDGEIEHWVSVQRDVTEERQQEEALREAKEEAERMNHLKSAFLANMSHEIRTPLTSILGFAEAIAEEVGRADAARELDLPTLAQFSGLIEKSGHRLMNTLTGVLNLSKLEAGEMDLSLEPVDLAVETEEATEQFILRAKEAGIDLRVETGSSPLWIQADEGGLGIVLRNLVSNAIKYTERGGTIWVRARAEENLALLEVEDTGIGMDPEAADGLFAAFKQASEGVGRQYEGTGLGLAVTKKVLDQMGGSIEVETQEGEGSRFTVRLPRSDPPGEA